jgi:indolepyruvate ferredoxin oxidoreductase
LLPPRTWQNELKFGERFAATIQAARELGMNHIHAVSGHSPLGFIVTGMAGPYLRHVLADLGLAGAFPILQMGMSYPVDAEMVREFARTCDQMIVIEERRSFLERNLRDALFQTLPQDEAASLNSRLFGKRFPKRGTGVPPVEGAQHGRDAHATEEGIPETRGLNYSVLAQKLIPLIKGIEQIPPELRNGRLTAEITRLREASRPRLAVIAEKIVPRTPTFCPGCPHRDSSSVLLEIRKSFLDPAYMKRVHNRAPVDLVSHGDTGCYTMLMFAPTEQLMHNYSGMGLGAGTGSGIDPFISNKQLVFMGDGTFFHSGQIAISNAVKANQDIAFIILENGTTAMTGHQDHAAVQEDMFGNKHPIVDIFNVVRGMAQTAPIKLVKIRPDDREEYRHAMEKTILADGVKVIIADKECGITYHRTKGREERKLIKQLGYLPAKTHMNITPEVCEGCLECTKQTACPGLTTIDTDYGRKIDTDLTWCVNDGACERVRTSNDYGTNIKPCPSFEQVTVVRKKRRRYLLPNMGLDKLPEPEARVHDMTQPAASWRVHMSGVGGMGIGLAGAILVRAGHKEGFRVIFQDKKGLAIRNGGVFSQITFVNDDRGTGVPPVEAAQHGRDAHATEVATTGSIPYGKADLLLGIDVLEAARAVDPREQFRVASKAHTAAVLNLHKQPTVYTLLGRQDVDPDALREEILTHCRDDLSYARNLSEICEQRLGSKQFVNIMMLGVAYQLGLIPVSAHSIAWAIKDTIKREHRRNLKAFNIGRKLALEPRVLPRKPQPETWEQLLVNKARILRKAYGAKGAKLATQLETLVNGAIRVMPDLPERSKYDLALRIYDTMMYEDQRFARRYIDLVRGVHNRDSSARSYAATAAAIWNLAKVLLIKDEVYVSYLLTRYEKKQRDIVKYNVDVANGDELVYRHHTKPELNFGPYRLRLNITTRDWMLSIAKNARFLRRLPGWHKRESAFRDWYIALLHRVDLATDSGYAQGLRVLRSPENVSGYREIRYPKMDVARREAEEDLARPRVDVELRPVRLEALETAGV